MTTSHSGVEKDQLKPVEELSFKGLTFLDAIFMSKTRKKPVWATTTDGSKTTMWRVSRVGKLEEVAAIRWHLAPDHGSGLSNTTPNTPRKDILVEVNGEVFPAEKFGKKNGNGLRNRSM